MSHLNVLVQAVIQFFIFKQKKCSSIHLFIGFILRLMYALFLYSSNAHALFNASSMPVGRLVILPALVPSEVIG